MVPRLSTKLLVLAFASPSLAAAADDDLSLQLMRKAGDCNIATVRALLRAGQIPARSLLSLVIKKPQPSIPPPIGAA